MKLNLKRPLAVFDLETTGTNVATDRIVEICILKIHPDSSQETKTWKVNPTIPIPEYASMVHGIYDADVAGEPTFKQLAKTIANFLANADLAGYNCHKFDVPILMEEFLRAEIDFDIDGRKIVDVQNIFHQMEQRTLKAAYKFYCEKELIQAHSAEADTLATFEVLIEQVQRYEKVPYIDKQGKESFPVKNDMDALHRFSIGKPHVDFAGRMIYDEHGRETFNFGKHKGKLVEEVFKAEPSYYDWMMKGDFPLYTKKKLTELRLRMKFVR